MADRRTILRGLAALPLAGLVPATALAHSATPDPFTGYHREILDLFAANSAREDESDEAAVPFMERWEEIDELGRTTRPTTLAGALGALEWARREHVQFNMSDDEADADPCNSLILALFDGALGVLRPMVEGGARG